MGWPTEASEWITRQPRNWPSTDLVEGICTSGFMIVPKPSDMSGDTREEWRLSFSVPEAKLFDSFDGVLPFALVVCETLERKAVRSINFLSPQNSDVLDA